jgi:hypothetical protein
VAYDRVLRNVTYTGGSGDLPLTRGQSYDLRFLDDRLTVSLSAYAVDVADLPYRDVGAMEVSGSDRSKSTGQTAAVILGLALVGAVLGLILLGLLGFLLGALIFGLIGALITASKSRLGTILRLRVDDDEVIFSTSKKTPDAIRTELAGPLKTITGARTAQQPGAAEPAAHASASIPDQLSKLASLLADGLLSREEFEHLKAKVIAQS